MFGMILYIFQLLLVILQILFLILKNKKKEEKELPCLQRGSNYHS